VTGRSTPPSEVEREGETINMPESEEQLQAAEQNGLVVIRVSGRGTFRLAQDLRNYLRSVTRRNPTRIVFDLGQCESLDSTFMGVLAMIALDWSGKTRIAILNAGEHVRKLLEDIGLAEMFEFVSGKDAAGLDWAELHRITSEGGRSQQDEQDMARTVLEAHETLMKISEDNVPKFRSVVDLLREEIEGGGRAGNDDDVNVKGDASQ